MALGSSCSDTRIAVGEKGAGACQHSGLRWVNCGQLLYIPFTVYFQKTLMNGRATLLFKGFSGWLLKEGLPEGDWSLQSNTWWVNAPYPGQEEINTLFRSSPLCISSLSLFLWFSSVEPLLLASSLSMFLLSSVALLKLSFFSSSLFYRGPVLALFTLHWNPFPARFRSISQVESCRGSREDVAYRAQMWVRRSPVWRLLSADYLFWRHGNAIVNRTEQSSALPVISLSFPSVSIESQRYRGLTRDNNGEHGHQRGTMTDWRLLMISNFCLGVRLLLLV